MEEKMSDERRARFLANIHNEVGRLQDIVDHLLELASLENLKTLTKRETVSIGSMVKTILESLRPIISKKELTIVNRVKEDVLIVGDSFLLHRAISNLVQNAVDFSPAHGQVILTVKQKEGFVDFVIEDKGPGIPDYALDKVFEKFFSLQRPDTGRKSTGLGLNFVKEVAVLHHGDVVLKNRTAGGAQAVLRLESRFQSVDPV